MPLLSLLVNNNFGVLTKVTGLFSRRGYNIAGLSVGETQHCTLSRITVQTETDSIQQICRQLQKLEDVHKAVPLPENDTVDRELLLVKIKLRPGRRERLESDLYGVDYRIAYETGDKIIITFAGDTKSVSSFISALSSHTIIELCRTGITAMATEDWE
jgi:acetolactate synthase-1/3 small subunit